MMLSLITTKGISTKEGFCMKICPKCYESIGENLDECPLCKYHFTVVDNERFLKEKESEEHRIAQKMEDLRAKRARMRLTYFLVMMSLYLFPFMIGGTIAALSKNFNLFYISAIVSIVSGTAVMITGLINGAFRCPYCDMILINNYGKHCTHCGKQLYY